MAIQQRRRLRAGHSIDGRPTLPTSTSIAGADLTSSSVTLSAKRMPGEQGSATPAWPGLSRQRPHAAPWRASRSWLLPLTSGTQRGPAGAPATPQMRSSCGIAAWLSLRRKAAASRQCSSSGGAASPSRSRADLLPPHLYEREYPCRSRVPMRASALATGWQSGHLLLKASRQTSRGVESRERSK
jgi:hypothetical protein